MGTDLMVLLVAAMTVLNGIVNVVGLTLLYRQRRYFSPPEAALYLESRKLRETYAEMAASIDGKLDTIYAEMRATLRPAP